MQMGHRATCSVLPSPRRFSARPFLLPAASTRSFSRFSSCSRSSFLRWFRAAAPRIFFADGENVALASSMSPSSSWGAPLSFDDADDPDLVRCRLLSSFPLRCDVVSRRCNTDTVVVTHGSSSSLLRFPLRDMELAPVVLSFLLSSIACRSCSAS